MSTQISLIVAIDEQSGMGKDNQLLCHLPRDLQHFKALTMGKPIIMGRKTYESIGRPLPLRVNLVLTRQHQTLDGALAVDSLNEALRLCQGVEEVMIIGGARVYQQALPLAQCIYLTRIHARFPADVFFPVLDETQWHCQEAVTHEADEKNPYAMTFCRYSRLKIK